MTALDQFTLTTVPIEQYFDDTPLGHGTGFMWLIRDLCLSQTSSGWQMNANRAMLPPDVGPLQTDLVGACRAVPIETGARGGEPGAAPPDRCACMLCGHRPSTFERYPCTERATTPERHLRRPVVTSARPDYGKYVETTSTLFAHDAAKNDSRILPSATRTEQARQFRPGAP